MPRQNVLVGIVSYFPCVVAIAAVPWFNIPPILLLLHSTDPVEPSTGQVVQDEYIVDNIQRAIHVSH